MNANDIEFLCELLETELWEVEHRIGIPTYAAEGARKARMAQIQAELNALPKPER